MTVRPCLGRPMGEAKSSLSDEHLALLAEPHVVGAIEPQPPGIGERDGDDLLLAVRDLHVTDPQLVDVEVVLLVLRADRGSGS